MIDPIMDDRDCFVRHIKMAHEIPLCRLRYADHMCCFSETCPVERQPHGADPAFFCERKRQPTEIVDCHNARMAEPWNPASKMLVWQVDGLLEERELLRKPDRLLDRSVSAS